MSGPVDPFDRTEVIPGVPELPAEETLILSGNSPSRPKPVPARAPERRRRWPLVAAGVGAALLIAAGVWWWMPRAAPSEAEISNTSAEAVPPGLRGYLDAANQGDPRAMRMLGACYTYGLGVRPNPAEGRAWYRKAAEAGDQTATLELYATDPKAGR